MNCDRVIELIPKVVDREALEWETAAVEEHTAGCRECASLRSDLTEIGSLVRAPAQAAVVAADFSGFWTAVSRGIDAAQRDTKPARPRVSLFVWPALSRLASAAAVAAVLVVALVFAPARQHFGADNRIEVSSIEGGSDNTVMIFESPDDNVTFIWVLDEVPDQEKAPI